MTNTTSDSVRLMPKPRRTRWFRLAGVTLLLTGTALIGARAWWGRHAREQLDQRIAAYRAAREPMLPADLVAPKVPAERNAVVDLRAASAALDHTGEPFAAFDALPDPVLPLTDAERGVYKALVDAHPDALARARAAAAKPGVDWGLAFDEKPLLTIQLDLKEPRALAHLLGAAALLAHVEGDDREALRRVRETLAIARATNHQPTIVSRLVAIGIDALACHRLNQIATGLRVGPGERDARPADVRALIDALLDVRPLAEAQQRALRGERVMHLDAAEAWAEGRLTPDVLTRGAAEKGASAFLVRAQAYALRPTILADAAMMADYMADAIRASDAPDLIACGRRMPAGRDELITRNRYLHLFASLMMPALGRMQYQHYRGIADRRLAATALAARWYAADHDGRLPARLEELVPKYLPEVPLDPLTDGKPLGYLPGDGNRPVVYSVGENLRDDGGQEVADDAPLKVRREQGDLIVHLKRQPRKAEPTTDADVDAEPPGGAGS